MKTREIKELTTNEIQERLDGEREHLSRLTLNHAISPLDNPVQIRESRKTVARFATELRQRELKQQ
ncbi:MAG TPA: 50S ribosomal protein L29 [Paludibacteraceae bacterium]|nr:50S ribosomal protein L29 [Paludibacteraceae bacterium]